MYLLRALLVMAMPVLARAVTHEEDFRFIKIGKEKLSTSCSGVDTASFMTNAERKKGIARLEELTGTQNAIADMIESSNSQEDLRQSSVEYLQSTDFLQSLIPLLMATSVLNLWCCLGCTACFRSCQCCRKERGDGSRKVKAIFGIILVGTCIAAVVFLAAAIESTSDVLSSASTSTCSLSKILVTTLDGQHWSEGQSFKGLVPLLQALSTLSDNLRTGSPLLKEINDNLKETISLERSSLMMHSVIESLRVVVDTKANTSPYDEFGRDLYHTCLLCRALLPMVISAEEFVQSSSAQTSVDARSIVKKKLVGHNLKQIQVQVEVALATLRASATFFRTSLGVFFEGSFAGGRELGLQFLEYLSPILIATTALVFLLCVVVLALFVNNERGHIPETEFFAARSFPNYKPPYNPVLYQIARVTWCLALFLCMISLIVSGTLMVIYKPASGLCLVMAEVTTNTSALRKYGQALGINTSNAEVTVIGDILDECVANDDRGQLLGTTWVRECQEQSQDNRPCEKKWDWEKEKVTLIEKLQDASKHMAGQLEAAAQAPPDQGVSLEDLRLPRIQELLDVPLDQVVTFNTTQAELAIKNPFFAAIVIDSTLRRDALYTSLSCDSSPMPKAMRDAVKDTGAADLPETVPGLWDLRQALVDWGAHLGGTLGNCTDKVLCQSNPADDLQLVQKCINNGLSGPACNPCEAGNALLDLKQQLREHKDYVCSFFIKADGSTEVCDPSNMNRNVSLRTWNDDCVFSSDELDDFADLRVELITRKCDLPELISHVQGFRGQLDKAGWYFSDAYRWHHYTIKALKQLIDNNILDEIDSLTSSSNCSAMSSHSRDSIDHLCYKMILAMADTSQSLFLMACANLAFALVMYMLEKRAKDNYFMRPAPRHRNLRQDIHRAAVRHSKAVTSHDGHGHGHGHEIEPHSPERHSQTSSPETSPQIKRQGSNLKNNPRFQALNYA